MRTISTVSEIYDEEVIITWTVSKGLDAPRENWPMETVTVVPDV